MINNYKSAALNLIGSLPETVSLDEIIYQLQIFKIQEEEKEIINYEAEHPDDRIFHHEEDEWFFG
jgi:hypothetical protein